MAQVEPEQKYGQAKQTSGYTIFFFSFPPSSGNIPDHQTLDFFARQLFKVSKWTRAKASRFLSIGAIMELYANKVSWFTVTLK